ncbi:hypothetical protein KUM39_02565 [Streptomyces sp. J2-1]|uniref:ArgS-related anticodon-binding protein NrtL n=1 Tax=Streptomyces corallincola TaxID=2851888 RepID=UPI001C39183C|nr:DALR anticodon-binding domain-containing protein [Streptomyces corallincola]MBV2353253.1 hypothetical protein [Streptomyces corallincola]
MTPDQLSRLVLDAVRRAVDAGEIGGEPPVRVLVEEPRGGGIGDYASNVALQLARGAGMPPPRVAALLRDRLVQAPGIHDVVLTGPGFLNFVLDRDADPALAVVRDIRALGAAYGHGDSLVGQVVVLRVPREVRAEAVADAVAPIIATQGGRAEITYAEITYPQPAGLRPVRVPEDPAPLGADAAHDRPRITADLRPVPAPEDPAPLGADAARWALLCPAAHDRPRITAEHLVQRESNPLFRVRYAHARVRAAVRDAARLGFAAEPGPLGLPEGPPGHAPGAHPLLTTLPAHPRILLGAATHRAPDRLARHLVTVADGVLPLLPDVLPRGDEKPSAAHRARLALAEAAGTVLAGGLSLLGIDAPEHL